MRDGNGPGIAASVFNDSLDGVKGAHGADIQAMGAVGYHALYRWAPRFASWIHKRKLMSPFVMDCVSPIVQKVCCLRCDPLIYTGYR